MVTAIQIVAAVFLGALALYALVIPVYLLVMGLVALLQAFIGR